MDPASAVGGIGEGGEREERERKRRERGERGEREREEKRERGRMSVHCTASNTASAILKDVNSDCHALGCRVNCRAISLGRRLFKHPLNSHISLHTHVCRFSYTCM